MQTTKGVRAPLAAELTKTSAATEKNAFLVCNPVEGISLVLADALQWMAERDNNSVHAIVTDPTLRFGGV